MDVHTKVAVQMNWTRMTGYDYSYNFNTTVGIFTFNNTPVYNTTKNS